MSSTETSSGSTPFVTTVVGSLPKPAWLYEDTAMSEKFKELHGQGAAWALSGEALHEAQNDAVRVAIHDQERAGIDIITDGEQRRKSYVTYVTRKLDGLDYETLAEKWVRGGRRLAQVGRCVGPVTRRGPMLVQDLRFAISEARSPLKVTMPGPMTVVDSILDIYYRDERALALAVADALNQEARDLEAAGAAVIQFDEPLFSRYPEKVSQWGIEALDRCIEGIEVETAVHICYSYPMPGVPRPIVPSYPEILPEVEKSKVRQVALEFEAPALDPALLRLCPSKTVIFGCVSNGSEEVESPEHIASRLLEAARYHPPEKLQAAPDCGLVTLGQASARSKLASLAKGAELARQRL
ncbi:MAG: 5-methyltetrahydropteroyltriglutamate--homocysteine methyltransferase [Chloroflexi bacterium]|nr:5-methyltetrahydropteroyltriglutamate--homocysteine methyltransferase [Chloroflexota bacterium]